MHTNETQYYELPQYVGSDIINPLVDTNDAYQKIDTALHNIAEEAGQGTSDIANLQTKVGDATLDTTAQDLSGAVNELNDELDNASTGIKARLDAVESDVDTLQSQMVTAQGNITDLQNNKANQSEVNAALALKANQSDVDTALALKANKSDINGTFLLVDRTNIVITADGVKTYPDLLKEACNEMLALVGTGKRIKPVQLTVGDFAPMFTANKWYGENTESTFDVFDGVHMEYASGVMIAHATLGSDPSAFCHLYTCDLNATPTITLTNRDAEVPASGTRIFLLYEEYRAV